MIKPMDMDQLQNNALFFGLSEKNCQSLIACGEVVSYHPDQMIIEESDLNHDLFLLLQGRVGVEIRTPNPDSYLRSKKNLTILKGGETFGEIAYLTQTRRVASVVAMGQVSALRLNKTLLDAWLLEHPLDGYYVMRNLAAILAQRLTQINFMWRDDV